MLGIVHALNNHLKDEGIASVVPTEKHHELASEPKRIDKRRGFSSFSTATIQSE